MVKRSESKAVERSCRLFRRLLVAYPKAHREEYGDSILQLFRDQCRDAWAATRTRGLIGFWLRALADLLKTSVWEHFAKTNRRKTMLKSFQPQTRLLFVFFSVFTAVFVLATAGSTVITFIYPKTYASSTRLMIESTVTDPSFQMIEFQAMLSQPVLSRASEALNLSQVWSKKYNNGEPMKEADVESILKSRLELSSVRNSRFIQIRAFSDDPNEAAKIANGVAEAYRNFRAGQLGENAGTPMERRVSIMDHAVPQPRAVRPNVPMNILAGAMIGILVGVLSGTIAVWAVWFIGRLTRGVGGPGKPASSDILA